MPKNKVSFCTKMQLFQEFRDCVQYSVNCNSFYWQNVSKALLAILYKLCRNFCAFQRDKLHASTTVLMLEKSKTSLPQVIDCFEFDLINKPNFVCSYRIVQIFTTNFVQYTRINFAVKNGIRSNPSINCFPAKRLRD